MQVGRSLCEGNFLILHLGYSKKLLNYTYYEKESDPYVFAAGDIAQQLLCKQNYFENLSIIQRGMSSKEVIAIMGKPSYRSFDEESEMLEFRTSESSIAGVVNIWFVDDRVTKMKSYHTNGCMDRNRAIEDKEEEESAKKEKKEKEETSARIRVTTDGKHIIQTGSIIVTPDGKHETVVSDCGGVIITASGEHILAP